MEPTELQNWAEGTIAEFVSTPPAYHAPQPQQLMSASVDSDPTRSTVQLTDAPVGLVSQAISSPRPVSVRVKRYTDGSEEIFFEGGQDAMYEALSTLNRKPKESIPDWLEVLIGGLIFTALIGWGAWSFARWTASQPAYTPTLQRGYHP